MAMLEFVLPGLDCSHFLIPVRGLAGPCSPRNLGIPGYLRQYF